MIKADILPKTPPSGGRIFKSVMRRVMKLVYTDSEIYWLTLKIYFGRN